MKYLFIYHQGDVPADKEQENIDQLWQWLDNLSAKGIQQNQFVASGKGQTVTKENITDYSDKVFGVSIIEADSMEAAKEIAKNWPELPHGGRMDILESLQ